MNSTIQPLDPIAFSLGPIQVHWYGLIIGCGLALALFLAIREGDKRELPKDTFADLMLWAIPIATRNRSTYWKENQYKVSKL
jgi:phosphatidylglycerol:prolipoprotein diacylglycerol transferase